MSKVEPSFASQLVRRLTSGLKTAVAPLMIFVPGAVPVSENVPSRYTLTLVLLATQLSLFAQRGTVLIKLHPMSSFLSLEHTSQVTPINELIFIYIFRRRHQLLLFHESGFQLERI